MDAISISLFMAGPSERKKGIFNNRIPGLVETQSIALAFGFV